MREIPKIIHYCWFGRGEKSEIIKKCIESWKTVLPDYQIIEWNEDNVNIDEEIAYVQEAYAAKKFAFVSDYVRVKALSEYGGVYFDTDLEVLKRFDEYVDGAELVVGFESERSLLTAFIASCPGNEIMKGFTDTYLDRRFVQEDGQYDISTINSKFSVYMANYGVDLSRNEYQEINSIKVYPIEVFCGFDTKNWHEKIGADTRTVHHMASSWVSGKKARKAALINFLQRILGYDRYDALKSVFRPGK